MVILGKREETGAEQWKHSDIYGLGETQTILKKMS